MSASESVDEAQLLLDEVRLRQLSGVPIDLVASAISVFGSDRAAVAWFWAPAMGLDGARPFELLDSEAGIQLVRDFLVRLRFGVYT